MDMKSILSRFSRRVIMLTVVASLAVTGSALAFFTATSNGGTGDASAAVGSANTDVTVGLSGALSTALLPGDSQFVTVTLSNSNKDPVTFNHSIHTLTVNGITSDKPGCVMSDFSMTPLVVNQTLPQRVNGSTPSKTDITGTAATGGLLTFTDSGVAQDACQGAALTLHLTSP